jgi:hypothetical protein
VLLQATRLLAAVLAKNAVGSSWRKTLGTREWSRVPAEEKAGVRGAALRLLFAEPAERVAVQLAMLVTNIARCVSVQLIASLPIVHAPTS